MSLHLARNYGLSGNFIPNTFIGGIAKQGGTGVNAPIDTPYKLATKLGISVNRITGFKVIGDDVECFIKGFENPDPNNTSIPNNCFSNNSNIEEISGNIGGCLGGLTALRNCSNLEVIDLPNIETRQGTSIDLNNSYCIYQVPKIRKIKLSSATILYHNYINLGANNTTLEELDVSNVNTMNRKGLRGVKLPVINLKKLKVITNSPASENLVFIDFVSPTVILQVNSFLLTNDSGNPDPHILAFKGAYPMSTVEFYDDAGNYVSTL